MRPNDETSEHEAALDDAAAYALGILPEHEALKVRTHLRTCAQCRSEYARHLSAVTAVAYSTETAPEAVACAALKARIMRQVRLKAAPVPKRRNNVWPAYLAAAACFLFALGTGWADLHLHAQIDQERAQSAQQTRILADFTAGDAQRYLFAKGEVLTHEGRLYIALHGLATLPAGHVYQAWTLARGAKTMLPSLTFTPSNTGAALVTLPTDASAIAAVAVSVEPAGGSPQPTTPPVAVVKIKA